MGRNAPCRQPLPDRAPLRVADSEISALSIDYRIFGGLGENVFDVLEQVGMIPDEHERACRREFLVSIGDEYDVTIQRHPGSLERDHRHEMSYGFAFHVDGTATPDVAVLHNS